MSSSELIGGGRLFQDLVRLLAVDGPGDSLGVYSLERLLLCSSQQRLDFWILSGV